MNLLLMKNRAHLVLFFFLFCGWSSFAQQTLPYSQYTFNPFSYNPACAGYDKSIEGSLTYRSHLVGIEGGPVSQLLTFRFPVQTKYFGLGLKLANEQIGHINQLSLLGAYSYHISLSKGKFSVGLSGGIFHQKMDWNSLIISDPSDPAIPKDVNSITIPDADLGLFYYNKSFFTGFSIAHLIKGKISHLDESSVDRNPSQLSRHYYFTMGFKRRINEMLKIEPSFLQKAVASSPWQFDLNLDMTIKDFLVLGVTYRTDDAFVTRTMINLGDHFSFGYSYDIRTSELANYSRGSHEVMILYSQGLDAPVRKKIVHPRFYF